MNAPVLLSQQTMLASLQGLFGMGLLNGTILRLLELLGFISPFLLECSCSIGILDLFEVTKHTNVLQYHICLEFVLGLSSPGAYTKNMACKISILDGPDLFRRLGFQIALVQTGQ
jgi:hypothetical protein